MKHAQTSYLTKKALSAALKHQMEKKPLKKITINDLITECNINRKTFYYHFEDIYALLKWTLEQEAIEVVKQFDIMTSYRDMALFAINYVETNTHILNCAYDGVGRDELKRFLYNDFYELTEKIVSGVEQRENVTLSADFHKLLCDIYTEAFAGMLVSWFREGKHRLEDTNTVIQNLTLIVRSSLPAVVRSAAQEGATAAIAKK